MSSLTKQPSLPLGVAAAAVTAVVSGVLWTLIGNATDGAQIGIGAIAVGALVGFVAGKAGGQDPVLAVIAGLAAVLAVFIGDVFIVAHFGAEQLKVSSFTIATDYTSDLKANFKQEFEAISLLFYGLAAVTGFRVAMSAGASAEPAPVFEPPTAAPSDTPPPVQEPTP